MLLLVNSLYEKNVMDSQNRRNFDSVRAVCNLHSCYMKNAFVFRQFEANKVFLVYY